MSDKDDNIVAAILAGLLVLLVAFGVVEYRRHQAELARYDQLNEALIEGALTGTPEQRRLLEGAADTMLRREDRP